MDGGAWRGYSPWGCKESDTTERLTHSRGRRLLSKEREVALENRRPAGATFIFPRAHHGTGMSRVEPKSPNESPVPVNVILLGTGCNQEKIGSNP